MPVSKNYMLFAAKIKLPSWKDLVIFNPNNPLNTAM